MFDYVTANQLTVNTANTNQMLDICVMVFISLIPSIIEISDSFGIAIFGKVHLITLGRNISCSNLVKID